MLTDGPPTHASSSTGSHLSSQAFWVISPGSRSPKRTETAQSILGLWVCKAQVHKRMPDEEETSSPQAHTPSANATCGQARFSAPAEWEGDPGGHRYPGPWGRCSALFPQTTPGTLGLRTSSPKGTGACGREKSKHHRLSREPQTSLKAPGNRHNWRQKLGQDKSERNHFYLEVRYVAKGDLYSYCKRKKRLLTKVTSRLMRGWAGTGIRMPVRPAYQSPAHATEPASITADSQVSLGAGKEHSRKWCQVRGALFLSQMQNLAWEKSCLVLGHFPEGQQMRLEAHWPHFSIQTFWAFEEKIIRKWSVET